MLASTANWWWLLRKNEHLHIIHWKILNGNAMSLWMNIVIHDIFCVCNFQNEIYNLSLATSTDKKKIVLRELVQIKYPKNLLLLALLLCYSGVIRHICHIERKNSVYIHNFCCCCMYTFVIQHETVLRTMKVSSGSSMTETFVVWESHWLLIFSFLRLLFVEE